LGNKTETSVLDNVVDKGCQTLLEEMPVEANNLFWMILY